MGIYVTDRRSVDHTREAGVVSCVTRGCPSRSTNPELSQGAWLCPTCRHEAGLDAIRSLPLDLQARLNGLDRPVRRRPTE